MNGTSGFQEVRSSISRSPSYRLLHEQQPQFGTGSWHLLRTHDLIALSTDISTKQETVPDTVFMFSRSPSYRLLHEQQPQFGTGSWHLLRTHDLIGLPTDISTKRETVPDTVFMPQRETGKVLTHFLRCCTVVKRLDNGGQSNSGPGNPQHSLGGSSQESRASIVECHVCILAGVRGEDNFYSPLIPVTPANEWATPSHRFNKPSMAHASS